MKADEPHKGFFGALLNNKKFQKPVYVIIIIVGYIFNTHFKFIKAEQILALICIILICAVLLGDTIFKCVQPICKMNVDIEKEKTKQKEIENNSQIGDVKIYRMNRDKNKRA